MGRKLMSQHLVQISSSPHQRHKLYRSLTAGLTGSVLAVTLAACNSSTDASKNGGSGEEQELQEVTVRAISITDVAPLHLTVQETFFEEEGLDVEIEETTGDAVPLTSVLASDYNFAFLNGASLMMAIDQGLDVQFIANGI